MRLDLWPTETMLVSRQLLPQQVVNRALAWLVQRSGGLVEKQPIGREEDGANNAQALLLLRALKTDAEFRQAGRLPIEVRPDGCCLCKRDRLHDNLEAANARFAPARLDMLTSAGAVAVAQNDLSAKFQRLVT